MDNQRWRTLLQTNIEDRKADDDAYLNERGTVSGWQATKRTQGRGKLMSAGDYLIRWDELNRKVAKMFGESENGLKKLMISMGCKGLDWNLKVQ